MSSYRVENRIIPIMLITSYLQPVMRTCLNVAAVLMGFGVLGVVIGTTAAYAVAAIAALAYGLAAPLTREAAPAGQVAASWRESWRLFLGAPSMALNMFVYSTMRSADIIIVGSLAPADDVGRYAVLSTLSQLVTVATVALSQTLGPAIARHFQAGNLRAIRDDTNRYIRLASIVSSFVFGGVAVFGNHLDVIFGETYHTEGAVLILIPLGYLLSATLAPASFALTMGGKAGLDLAILVASAVGLVVACVALTSWFGIGGDGNGRAACVRRREHRPAGGGQSLPRREDRAGVGPDPAGGRLRNRQRGERLARSEPPLVPSSCCSGASATP